MNLRPIETMGFEKVVEALGLSEVGSLTTLNERMPWPPPGGLGAIPALQRDSFLLADPLAVYLFVRIEGEKVADDAIGLGIYSPTGDTIDDGFLFQRFLIWTEGNQLKATSQESVTHTGGEVDPNIMLTGADGPQGMGTGLSAEVGHAVAGLLHATRGTGR